MSDGAQLENGYTKVANEILEMLAITKLNGTQLRILLIIFRYTYGFHRKEHNLSLAFLSNATSCDKRQVQRELKELEKLNIITQNIKSGSYRKISFNNNYKTWLTAGKNTIGEFTNVTIGKNTNKSIGELPNQERKKQNFKENIYTPVINYLNEKCCTSYKQSSIKTKACINARIKEGFTIENFKQVIDTKAAEWMNTDMARYLRPETLFGTKFESYLNQKGINDGSKPGVPDRQQSSTEIYNYDRFFD